jgi:hypothetical protein
MSSRSCSRNPARPGVRQPTPVPQFALGLALTSWVPGTTGDRHLASQLPVRRVALNGRPRSFGSGERLAWLLRHWGAAVSRRLEVTLRRGQLFPAGEAGWGVEATWWGVFW